MHARAFARNGLFFFFDDRDDKCLFTLSPRFRRLEYSEMFLPFSLPSNGLGWTEGWATPTPPFDLLSTSLCLLLTPSHSFIYHVVADPLFTPAWYWHIRWLAGRGASLRIRGSSWLPPWGKCPSFPCFRISRPGCWRCPPRSSCGLGERGLKLVGSKQFVTLIYALDVSY